MRIIICGKLTTYAFKGIDTLAKKRIAGYVTSIRSKYREKQRKDTSFTDERNEFLDTFQCSVQTEIIVLLRLPLASKMTYAIFCKRFHCISSLFKL